MRLTLPSRGLSNVDGLKRGADSTFDPPGFLASSVGSSARFSHLSEWTPDDACHHGLRMPSRRGHVTRGLQIDDGRILAMETTEKQRAIEALRTLPDQATIEDAIERLCFIAKIEEGLRQSEAGQLVSHDEVKRQFLS